MKATQYEHLKPRADRKWTLRAGLILGLLACLTALELVGCGSASARKSNAAFFTSGNRAADQRAAQRMAQSEQLADSGGNAEPKGVKKADAKTPGEAASATNGPVQAPEKRSLYEQLGSEAGISNIVQSFLPRAMDDPRVNWDRKGISRGGFSIHHWQSEEWKPNSNHVAVLKQHMTELLVLATGGPAHYTGRDIESVHANLHISNPEFDAVMGDLKASLDELRIPNLEQKELLAIVESTRPQVVTEH